MSDQSTTSRTITTLVAAKRWELDVAHNSAGLDQGSATLMIFVIARQMKAAASLVTGVGGTRQVPRNQSLAMKSECTVAEHTKLR